MPSAPSERIRSTIKGVSYFLAHVPGLVRYGSKPSREIAKDNGFLAQILNHLWTFEEAMALMEIALDVDKIAQGLNRVRQKGVYPLLSGGKCAFIIHILTGIPGKLGGRQT